jgi:hypothetical protein
MTKKIGGRSAVPGLRGARGAWPQWFGRGADRGAAPPEPGSDAAPGYRALASVPEAWRSFAERIQTFFQWRLAASGLESRRLCYLMEDGNDSKDVDVMVVANVWVTPRGFVERIDFEGADDLIAASLRKLLLLEHVGAMPPAGMLQPVRFKLSLGRLT